jgi:hypothetical protein
VDVAPFGGLVQTEIPSPRADLGSHRDRERPASFGSGVQPAIIDNKTIPAKPRLAPTCVEHRGAGEDRGQDPFDRQAFQ